MSQGWAYGRRLEYQMIKGGLCCLSFLLTIVQSYRDCQFYWWMKPGYLEKTTDLRQVADKNHIKLYQVHPSISSIRTRNFSGDNH